MTAFYNEIDPFAAKWLRNLIAAGHIAPGVVDERSIDEVSANDIKDFDQVHLFAGIGGWSCALRLASWADTRPVWTISCPCQPFSQAGIGLAFDDKRHLWPVVADLLRECVPNTIFGEQVASPAGLAWFDVVRSDMEAMGYPCGNIVLPSSSIGAPHPRHRNWWCAIKMADFEQARLGSGTGIVGNTVIARLEGLAGNGDDGDQPGWVNPCASGSIAAPGIHGIPWAELEWISCRDGKSRPTQPGLFPLAHGISARVGKLRAYGNAIVPQLAAEVIMATMPDFAAAPRDLRC